MTEPEPGSQAAFHLPSSAGAELPKWADDHKRGAASWSWGVISAGSIRACCAGSPPPPTLPMPSCAPAAQQHFSETDKHHLELIKIVLISYSFFFFSFFPQTSCVYPPLIYKIRVISSDLISPRDIYLNTLAFHFWRLESQSSGGWESLNSEIQSGLEMFLFGFIKCLTCVKDSSASISSSTNAARCILDLLFTWDTCGVQNAWLISVKMGDPCLRSARAPGVWHGRLCAAHGGKALGESSTRQDLLNMPLGQFGTSVLLAKPVSICMLLRGNLRLLVPAGFPWKTPAEQALWGMMLRNYWEYFSVGNW